MTTVYKYNFSVTDKPKIELPKGAEVLCVQMQGGFPCIWALVDNDAVLEDRYFELVGTGHPLNVDIGVSRKYIGTFQMLGGSLVWHLFERL